MHDKELISCGFVKLDIFQLLYFVFGARKIFGKLCIGFEDF